MPINLVGSAGIDALEQVLVMTQDRHKVLADNVANIDTPGYRMRDIDTDAFERQIATALRRARRRNPNVQNLNAEIGWDAGGSSRFASKLRSIVFHDDNDRNVESLMVQMSKNQIRQSQAATLMRNQLSILRAIAAENP